MLLLAVMNNSIIYPLLSLRWQDARIFSVIEMDHVVAHFDHVRLFGCLSNELSELAGLAHRIRY